MPSLRFLPLLYRLLHRLRQRQRERRRRWRLRNWWGLWRKEKEGKGSSSWMRWMFFVGVMGRVKSGVWKRLLLSSLFPNPNLSLLLQNPNPNFLRKNLPRPTCPSPSSRWRPPNTETPISQTFNRGIDILDPTLTLHQIVPSTKSPTLSLFLRICHWISLCRGIYRLLCEQTRDRVAQA